MRLGDLGEAQRREVRIAELEHARPQREAVAVLPHVPEANERQQQPAGGRAREARGPGDLAEPELGPLPVERADDRQPTRERLDELRAGGERDWLGRVVHGRSFTM